MNDAFYFNRDIIAWAITRAGYNLADFSFHYPKIKVKEWIEKKREPTLNQLEDFAKKVHIPFGYFFLPTIPKQENEIIPFYRSGPTAEKEISLNLYDEIITLQRRQDWLSNYFADNGYEKLPFVGKHKIGDNYKTIADDIRTTLGLKVNWGADFGNLSAAVNYLSDRIEELRIIVVSSGVANETNNRPISIDECRGFVLVDEYAPFIFVNSKDAKAAQIFTLAHELAHIWLGMSAGFDLKTFLPTDDEIELLCDHVAAEFLVPEKVFRELWRQNPTIDFISRYFKVSRIVVMRRALDLGMITRKEFLTYYKDFQIDYLKSLEGEGGGTFYDTHKKRISLSFAAYVRQAADSNQILYTDAHRLTAMKGGTYNKFMNELF